MKKAQPGLRLLSKEIYEVGTWSAFRPKNTKSAAHGLRFLFLYSYIQNIKFDRSKWT